MVYHPNEFETLVTRGQNKPLYCKVPDSLSESLARARLSGISDVVITFSTLRENLSGEVVDDDDNDYYYYYYE